jgi:hypothetical protein
MHVAKLGRSIARFIIIPSTTEMDYPSGMLINPQLHSPFGMAYKMKRPFSPHFVVLNDVAVYRKGDILGG